MRDLVKCTKGWVDKLSSIGIECGNIIEVKVNTRASNRWGLCKHEPTGHIIEISNKLVDEAVSDKAFDNTLVHELLHTVNGTKGHKGLWKELAEKVNNLYGLNIQRCTSSEEKGIERSESKYQISCPKCGITWFYQRYTRAVQSPQLYKCGRCKSNLVRVK